ncbi:MAG: tRNA (adenosine(37)-N6)-threonylcarbamoyltransferase complex transferase subunit TsaD [Chloroherpetonaceae bacterium]|nr:tRNA (adenosine(37)-N6)-threonylcarbamoyltransferase complex transferase subunit TsaD [Chloroherpetonaceae bacterium]
MNILALETSCDETSAAVLLNGKVASNIISSQLRHQEFGGVVPELASREHERLIASVTNTAMKVSNINKSDLDFISATSGPGLIGAVLVGLNFAQSFAYALGIPFIPINHIEAHIFSTFINDGSQLAFPKFPFISLTVSGGHTMLALVEENLSYKILGKTIDDAAGEGFDKTGKMLGLPYPAGPIIDKLAKEGNPHFHKFPQALMNRGEHGGLENFNFSFSGLKTSVQTYLQQQPKAFIETHLADICASIQFAIASALTRKTIAAAESLGIKTISVAGGVSANSELRRQMNEAAAARNISLFIPKPIYSTDNAAMIATLAKLKIERGQFEARRYNAKAFASL